MKLTVIIPVYNAEDTLANAIESVLTSFVGQEVLIIDDGSTDASWEISELYAGKYENVNVFHTENGGVSKARNLGIEKATGEYIMFMDADDRIIYDGTLNLDTYLNESDMILFSFIEKKMNGKILNYFKFKERQIKPEDIVSTFLENKYSFYGPWAKLYKKEIILREKLRFNEGQKYGEDVVFVISYLSNVSKGIRLSPYVIYEHYINPKGASFYTKYYDKINLYLFNQLKAFQTLVNETKGDGQKVIDDFACSLFNETILHYYQRIKRSEFLEKYLESYKLFAPYITVNDLRKYSLFSFLKDESAELNEQSLVEKVYRRNWVRKIKYECKKILYSLT